MKHVVTVIFLGLVIISLLCGAIIWEGGDIKKFYARPNVYDIKDHYEREKEYIFYSTFNYENHIMWRSLFISGVIASLIIYIFLKNYAKPDSLELNCFVIFFMVFLVYYLTHIYRSFHVYRVMASKIRKHLNIIDHMGEKPKKALSRISRTKEVSKKRNK